MHDSSSTESSLGKVINSIPKDRDATEDLSQSRAKRSASWHLLHGLFILSQMWMSVLAWRGMPWVVLLVTVIVGVANVVVLSGRELSKTDIGDAWRVIIVDAAVLGALLLMTMLRIGGMVFALRVKGRQSGTLSVQVPLFLGLLVLLPTVLMVGFALVLYKVNIESWFDQRVRQAINASAAISTVYLDEKTDNARLKTLTMARDLERNAVQLSNPLSAQEVLAFVADFRSSSEAWLFRAFNDGKIETIAQVGTRIRFDDVSVITQDVLQRAEQGETVVLSDRNGRYRAVLVELTNMPYVYLYVVDYIDTRVTAFANTVAEAAEFYNELDQRRAYLDISMMAIFMINAALMIVTSIWMGMGVGHRLVRPIHDLIDATSELHLGGAAFARIPQTGIRELEILTRSFQAAATNLAMQRDALQKSNQSLMERRIFIETVLMAINSGVISLDQQGVIRLANKRVDKVMGLPVSDQVGRLLSEVCPPLYEVFLDMVQHPQRSLGEKYLQLKNSEGESRSVLVHVVQTLGLGGSGGTSGSSPSSLSSRAGSEPSPHAGAGALQTTSVGTMSVGTAERRSEHEAMISTERANVRADVRVDAMGWVVTIDDLTPLVTAERRSAWMDVAQRVAHEIKNPLTPIQLASDRIARRVSILDDLGSEHREVLERCTQSINRHVDLIQRMVSEFALYARTPQAIMQRENVIELIREVVFDQKNLDPDNAYVFSTDVLMVELWCDRRLLQQALSNILINARHAHERAKTQLRSGGKTADVIRVSVEKGAGVVDIIVDDEGEGFGDPSKRNTLMEPYVAGADSKGSGLGLAIVYRIMEDHGGTLLLEEAPITKSLNGDGLHAGARVRLRFSTVRGVSMKTRTEGAIL